MKSSAGKIQMSGFNELFGLDSGSASDTERMREIPLAELFPFRGHPFQVLDDDAMRKMVESIVEHGVLSPGIARPRPEDQLPIYRDEAPVQVGRLCKADLTVNLVSGELARRSMGYDPEPQTDEAAIAAAIVHPFEMVRLRMAITAALSLGFGRDVDPECDDEVDLCLQELNEQKNTLKRAHYIRMGRRRGCPKRRPSCRPQARWWTCGSCTSRHTG